MHRVTDFYVLLVRFIQCWIMSAGYMCAICRLHVISTMILHTWFLYIEEFSIFPCPTCPMCQSYISVGVVSDTFADTVTCQVSKINACIRYDG